MKNHAPRLRAACFIATLTMLSSLPAHAAGSLFFSCAADNDLFRVTSENGMDVRRFDKPQAALEAATEGDAVLLLADGYPPTTVTLTPEFFASAAHKRLRL